MTPEEAIVAATINGAFAMGVAAETGSISKGKRANLLITKPIDSYNALPYHFGMHQIDRVLLNGDDIV
jgi:imidazolonepropionase